jgi:hypothetical protein
MKFIDFIDEHVQGSPNIPEYRRFDYVFMDHLKILINDFRQSRKDWVNSSAPIIPRDKETAPDTQAPTQKPAGKLPPVIQAVLDEGLLDTPPVNGRYLKKGDKKDANIIEWIFNFSGYGDSLTAELYMQHIQTRCKSTTIQDYITRNKSKSD